MKKSIFILLVIIGVSTHAQTVTLPTSKMFVDSALYEHKENYAFDGTWSNGTRSNGNTSFDVNVNQWNLEETDLDLILDNNGSVEECELVLRLPQVAMGFNINTLLPDTAKPGASGLVTRTWADYFNSNGTWYYNNNYYFLTTNHTGRILTGEQIKLILNVSPTVLLMGQSDPEFIQAKQ